MSSHIRGAHHYTINLAVGAWVEGVAGMRTSLNIDEPAAIDTLTNGGQKTEGHFFIDLFLKSITFFKSSTIFDEEPSDPSATAALAQTNWLVLR